MRHPHRLLAAGFTLLPLLAIPLLAQEPAPTPPKREKPLVRAVLHSYGRVERRARELAEEAGRPGVEAFALGLLEGFLQAPAGGFAGLDRTRPIQAAVASPNLLGIPRVVVTVPVADRAAAEQTLRAIFPETVTEGDALRLQGGPTNLAARFDAASATLAVALTLDALTSVDTSLPDEAGGDAGGPDLVIRWDADATRRQFAQEWRTARDELRTSLRDARAGFLDEAANNPVERAARETFYDLLTRSLEQGADDFASLDWSLTIDPAGWETTLSARMRAGSPSAVFLDRIGSPEIAMPAPAPDALARVEGAVGLTDELRTLARAVLEASRSGLTTKEDPAPEPDETRQQAEQVLGGFRRLLAQPALAFTVDIASDTATPEVTGCLLLVGAGPITDTWLEQLSRLKPVVTRDVARHGETAIHRIAGIPAGTADAATETQAALHVAAEGDYLAAGPSVDAVKRQLDRLRARASRTESTPVDPAPAGSVLRSGTLARVDVFASRLLRGAWANASFVDTGDPAVRRFLDRLTAEVEQPLSVDLRSGGSALSLRVALPGQLVRAVLAAVGERLPRGTEQKEATPAPGREQ